MSDPRPWLRHELSEDAQHPPSSSREHPAAPWAVLVITLLGWITFACRMAPAVPDLETPTPTMMSDAAVTSTPDVPFTGEEDEALQTMSPTLTSTNTASSTVTPLPPTPTFVLPVSGNVEIADDSCCAGDVITTPVTLTVEFTATSPTAPIVLMRVVTDTVPADAVAMSRRPWEPFVAQQMFTVVTPTDGMRFYVSVEYMDATSNRSPIYHDVIDIEGKLPTPTPALSP